MADWHSGLDDETRAYAVSKGLDKLAPDVAASNLVKSYRDLEGRLGRSVVLPEKEDAPEWDNVWKRLEKPLAARETARRAADEAAAVELANKAIADQQAALDKEWGADKEKREFLASKAAEALGWDKDTLQAVLKVRGVDNGMKDLYNLGTKMGEANFVRGGMENKPQTLTREQALAERNRLTTDPAFGKKIMEGDPEALKHMNEVAAAILGEPSNWQSPPRNFGRTHENPTGA